jgi:hypothetical protein
MGRARAPETPITVHFPKGLPIFAKSEAPYRKLLT